MNKLCLLMALMLFLILFGCRGNIDNGKNDVKVTPQKHQIALVMKTLTNPFFITMERGARRAEEELGIDLIVKTGSQETAITQQINIINILIDNKVDAIVIAPASSYELVPVLAKAQQAGIVIVNIDNELDKSTLAQYKIKNVPFISIDNEKAAYQSAKFICQNETKPMKAVILEGITTAKNSIDRKRGALRAFAEYSNIEVIATKTANWKIDEGYEVFEAMNKQYGPIDLVFCANDMMALGVIQYINENKLAQIKVAAFDNLDEVQEHIDSGALSVTIDQQANLQGYTGIETAVKLLNGETIENVTLEAKIVTGN